MTNNNDEGNKMKVPQRKDEFEIYMQKPIRAYGPNGSLGLGILNKISPRGIYLKPFLVHENLYDKKGDSINKARIEKKTPQFINTSNLQSIEPVEEGYIERLAKSINEIKVIKEKLYEKIGKWYLAHFIGTNEYHVGRIKYIEPGKIILNPFKGLRYDANKKKSLFSLINEDSEILYNSNQTNIEFEPTTKKTILNIINDQNEGILKALLKNNKTN